GGGVGVQLPGGSVRDVCCGGYDALAVVLTALADAADCHVVSRIPLPILRIILPIVQLPDLIRITTRETIAM
ncbi:MAG: hypothetical protein EBV03_11035, partial [Proteobacteria bacterium]|nr:hypothetical protein [Pseudomonadota bacterium]